MKYKIKPYNSYYHYKHKKRIRRKLFLMGLVVLAGIGFLLVVYGDRIKDFYQSKFLNQAVQVEKQVKPVYLRRDIINYGLFKTPTKVKGIYIPSRKMYDIEKYLKLANDTEINAFVIDIKDDEGYITYHTDNGKLIEMGGVKENPPIENIKHDIVRMYEEGVYPIARIVVFKDNVVGTHFPDRVLHDKEGKIYQTPRDKQMWLNPYDKRNWDYILELTKEVARLGFKEIQFDYVRFHESMNSNTVQLNPNQTKIQAITDFVAYMKENLEEYDIYLSADVFGTIITSNHDAEIVGQDYKEMVKHLDYISPMVYPSHYGRGSFGIEYPDLHPYDIILSAMEMSADVIKQNPRDQRNVIVRPWLQDFTATWVKPHQTYGKNQIRQQIKAVYDAGLEEWILWNAAGRYTEAALEKE